jgi:hypothetical protein
METTYDCPTCRRRQAFELLLVDESPGTQSPEWICTICDTALFADLSGEFGCDIGEGPATHVA